jgi:predicted SprT family Zn-dependent metalloprotease
MQLTITEARTMFAQVCDAANSISRNQIEVSVSFDLKGQVAGDFAWEQKHVRINAFVVSNYPDKLQELMIHEVAHAVDYVQNGHRKNSRGQYIGHDSKFRGYMRDIASELGATVSTKTTHDMNLPSARKMRKWKYQCGCADNIVISTVMHNRIQKKGQTRGCHTCGEWFNKTKFVEEVIK